MGKVFIFRSPKTKSTNIKLVANSSNVTPYLSKIRVLFFSMDEKSGIIQNLR